MRGGGQRDEGSQGHTHRQRQSVIRPEVEAQRRGQVEAGERMKDGNTGEAAQHKVGKDQTQRSGRRLEEEDLNGEKRIKH